MIAQETVMYADFLKKSSIITIFIVFGIMIPIYYYLLLFDIMTILGGSFIYFGVFVNSIYCYYTLSHIAESLSIMECKDEKVIENIWKKISSICLYNFIGFMLCITALLFVIRIYKTTFDIVIILCTSMATFIYVFDVYFAIKLESQLCFEHKLMTDPSKSNL